MTTRSCRRRLREISKNLQQPAPLLDGNSVLLRSFCCRVARHEDLNEPFPCLNAEASSLLFLADGLAALDFAALRAAAATTAEEAEGADRSPVCGRRSPGGISLPHAQFVRIDGPKDATPSSAAILYVMMC